MDILERIEACIIGHAVGDALGVPVEFSYRAQLDKNPVTDMIGFGTYNMPKGSWSDDTSMTLAALDSLKNGKLDYDEIMCNFCDWYYRDKYNPTGKLFDIGGTCRTAIENYHDFSLSTDKCGINSIDSNGNGSLMRIIPFILYIKYCLRGEIKDNLDIVYKGSALTHAHERSRVACGIYAFILSELLDNSQKDSIDKGLQFAKQFYSYSSEYETFSRLFEEDFINVGRDEIKSSGYVVDSLEAAVWCLLNSSSYKECVLKAVNLGRDTDTTAAIVGGLAGALYGFNAIPSEWRATLLRMNFIIDLCTISATKWVK